MLASGQFIVIRKYVRLSCKDAPFPRYFGQEDINFCIFTTTKKKVKLIYYVSVLLLNLIYVACPLLLLI